MEEQFTKKELAEIKKGVKEVRDLAKKFAGNWATVEGLTNSTLLNMKEIVSLGDKNTDIAKKEKKFREAANDITKEVLENTQNIGTEEFKTLDVSKKLAQARRMNKKDLIEQLTIAKKLNKEQQQQHKQIMGMAKIIQKPFEALDSFIRQIPVFGDLLADVANFGGIGENIAQGVIEGFTSGLVESADLGKKSIGFFSRMFTNNLDKAGNEMIEFISVAQGGKGAQAIPSLWSTMADRAKEIWQSISLGKIAMVGFALVLAKGVASMVSFANSTGLAYKDMLRMGPALLFNADAVKSFANELGTVNNLTGKQAFQLQVLEKRYALNAETAAKLFAVQRGIVGATVDQFIAQADATAQAARLAGVAPQAVFEDMAQNSEVIAKYMGSSSESMTKAAIQAKKMGINLGTADKIAESLLDFETSIEKQMEASVLLGRQINFDRARQLAFEGDIDGMLQNVAGQLGGIGQLSNLNVIQRKAIAGAIGMEVSELSKVIGAQEGLNQAAEEQKSSLLGSIAAGAALGAILVGTIMALKAVFSRGLSLKSDTTNAIRGYAAGMTAGAVAGGAGMFLYKSLTADNDMPALASGGVIVGEAGPELVAPLPSQGVNVDNSGVEKRMDMLIEQNQFLMRRLTNTVADMKMA